MQAQDMASPAEADDQVDSAILGLLLDSPALWSVQEIERQLDDPIAAADGLARLHRAGLIHRLDGFVFATRSAAHAADLAV